MPTDIHDRDNFREFPTFNGWSSNKVFFLENRAWYNFDSTLNDPKSRSKSLQRYVAITRERELQSDYTQHCSMCGQKIMLVFNYEIEEWVLEHCEEYNYNFYHFPTCYQFAVRRNNMCRD